MKIFFFKLTNSFFGVNYRYAVAYFKMIGYNMYLTMQYKYFVSLYGGFEIKRKLYC